MTHNFFYVFIYIFNSLHVSNTSCSSSGETNCVNKTSGSCRWPCRVQVGDLHTTRPPTQSDSYQRLYWHNLSLLMMSTMCSKHVKSKSKGVPRQAEVAQGVPVRLRPWIVLTFRHYKGGSSSAKRTGRLYPRRNPWYSLSETESTSGRMVLSGVPRKKPPVTQPGIDPGIVRLVAQRLNHCATPGPVRNM